jgi:tight adherence protein B
VVPVTTAPQLGLAVAALVSAGVAFQPSRSPIPRVRPLGPTAHRARGQALLDRLLPDRRDQRRDRQLPDALDRLGASLRAGTAIGPALVALAAEVPAPLGSELSAVARSIDHGGSVAEALGGWTTAHPASRDVRLVAAALTVGAGAGGEVARAVDGVAATLRERHQLAAEARSLAAQAHASASLLLIAPGLFGLLVATVEPSAIRFLLTTPVGLACLLLGVGLDAIGAVWMARITGGVR